MSRPGASRRSSPGRDGCNLLVVLAVVLAFALAAPLAAHGRDQDSDTGEPVSSLVHQGRNAAAAVVEEATPGDGTGHADDESEGEQEHDDDSCTDRPGEGHDPRLSDRAIPLQLEGFPNRPKPILELGEPFLGTGTLHKGFKIPGGAVWQPSFLLFGTFRAAAQTVKRGGGSVSEFAGRLDLFGNLQLSGTERLVIGFRALDESILAGDMPGDPDPELDTQLASIFFEGDFGELFPNLSRNDFSSTDWGFSVGRQPMLFQDGLLIADFVDGIGITRNTLQPHKTSNFRTTFFYGWNNINRGVVNREDESAQLFAVLTSTDFPWSTMDIDGSYVWSDNPSTGDMANVAVSATQRLGFVSSSFRLLGSFALDQETAASTDGTLVFGQMSWTPRAKLDHVYANFFWAVDEYSSATRDPTTGGPLVVAGINFASLGLGTYIAPLSSQARDVAGGAFGYQWFFANTRRQLIAEIAARIGTEETVENQSGLTLRYQVAMGRHFVVVADGFVGYREALQKAGDGVTLYGGRLEILTKF